jgi:L-seryl-tRNA(Ser) seleniumtransferase
VTAGERLRPPSVERVLALARPGAVGRDPEALLDAARAAIAAERERLLDGLPPRDVGALAAETLASLEVMEDPGSSGLVAVINATGVVLHTNLGRAAWPRAAIEAATRAAVTPVLLELDRATGRRGARSRIAEDHLVALTGAEDAFVTNNNAAAVALAVGLAGRGGRIAVSRGELVYIGGGVRIPEILRRAGVRLVEVGTTNRTRVADFAAALSEPGPPIRAILRVHPANFVQAGFVEAPEPRDVARLAHERGAIVIDDLGSGALLPTERVGLAHEPMPRERLEAGADIVTFSGDKLVGGPQAGLIVGRADLIARIRRDPLARAMRPDKATMAAVAATLALYRAGRAIAEIPVWRTLAVSPSDLQRRARSLVGPLGANGGEIVALESTVGGGSLPGEVLPSWGIALSAPAPARLLDRLRAGEPCVIARVERDRVILDLRTVAPEDDIALGRALAAALGG